ncbi:MAG: aconitase family protein, partial [Candidatus Neomarinimicrobiota bacterium]
ATILANACGPCIGQWQRENPAPSQKNSILTSFNRNFAGRNDGNSLTHTFLASPEIVLALTLAGDLRFNPLENAIANEKGQRIRLAPPVGAELPGEKMKIEAIAG